MRRSMDDVLAHADEIAARFEDFDPDGAEVTERPEVVNLYRALVEQRDAERNIVVAMQRLHADGLSYQKIGKMAGVSGEAIRQKLTAVGRSGH